jgi:CHAD domain-containing protein
LDKNISDCRVDNLRAENTFEKQLTGYLRKRVRELKATFEQIVEKSDSGAVHDFRKATRHLQTIVDAVGIRRPSRKTLNIRRRLQKCRHALGEWRDHEVVLKEVKKAERKARTGNERQCWSQVAKRTAKEHRRAQKKFQRNYKSLRVSATGAKVKALVKKKIQSEPMMDNLRLLLERGWEKSKGAIDDFLDDSTAVKLHDVRIKAKTLRYSVGLSQRLYPDNHLESVSEWLKEIQDRIGAWHDEFMLGQRALETFSRTPRDPNAVKLIREIKEKEIAMAESARDFISAIGKTKQYQRLQLLLSATVYAMTNGSDPEKIASESIRGPLQ